MSDFKDKDETFVFKSVPEEKPHIDRTEDDKFSYARKSVEYEEEEEDSTSPLVITAIVLAVILIVTIIGGVIYLSGINKGKQQTEEKPPIVNVEEEEKEEEKKNTWGQSKKVAILKPRREARRNQTFQHLDLGLLASRTVRK